MDYKKAVSNINIKMSSFTYNFIVLKVICSLTHKSVTFERYSNQCHDTGNQTRRSVKYCKFGNVHRNLIFANIHKLVV